MGVVIVEGEVAVLGVNVGIPLELMGMAMQSSQISLGSTCYFSIKETMQYDIKHGPVSVA